MGTVRAAAAAGASADCRRAHLSLRARRGRRSSTAASRPSAPTSPSAARPRTATRSRLPFHVTSSDWQESDQVLAGIISDFGSPTGAVRVRRPRRVRRRDDRRVPRAARRRAVHRRGSARLRHAVGRRLGPDRRREPLRERDGRRRARGDSEIRADGLFSLGYPARGRAAKRSTRGSASRAAISTACVTRSASTSIRCPGCCPASSI